MDIFYLLSYYSASFKLAFSSILLEKSNLFLSLNNLKPKFPKEIEILTKSGINAKFVNKLKNEQIANTIAALEISPNERTTKRIDATSIVIFEIKVLGSDFLNAA